ncbi:MAG: oligosaccharide flippase family protein [Pseudomonadota bacterium]|nr:oligosaccharide flippase family protein [Pseudomonadota bacterium]
MTTASRSIQWSKFFAVLTTVLRLGGALISFLVQVRFLGPHQFGVIGFAYTIAALASLVSDFGMNTYAMRWGSAKPELGDVLIPLCLIVKAVLSAMLLLPCLVWVHLLGFSAGEEIAAALAIIGFFMAATADVALIGLRFRSLFDREMIIVAWTTFVSLALVIVAATVTRDVVLTALSFAAGRALYLVAALTAIRETLAVFRPTARGLFRDGLALLVSAKVYAADLILSGLNQIDVVIIAFFVDTASVGRYVAVTRLVQNALPIVGMWATVYLPPLASLHANGKTDDYRSLARRMNMEFFAIGIVACLCVIVIGPLATPIIFGPAYDAVRPLWPGFGVFVMLIVLGDAYGFQLLALGQIRWRVGAQIAALAFTCGALVLLLPIDGVLAAPWILSGAALILLLSYGEAAVRQSNDAVSIRLYCLVCCATAAGIFVAFW